MSLVKAKRKLWDTYKNEDWFVGCGIGDQCLRLYVSSMSDPTVQDFRKGKTFEGYRVEVVKAGTMTAY